MRLAISGVILFAAAACGYSTSPSPTSSAFALDAGNYTLKISGTGTCGSGGAPLEGSGLVTITRSAATWTVRSSQATDTFAMSFTTDGAANGSVQGNIAGALSAASGMTINATGTISGNNSSANVAGGPITPLTGGPFGVTFNQSGATSSCVGATWTLTPR